MIRVTLFLYAILTLHIARAQKDYACKVQQQFARGNLIFFADNFNDDSAGSVPQRFTPISSLAQLVVTKPVDDEMAMLLSGQHDRFVLTQPKLQGLTHYLRDTFSFEFSFKYLTMDNAQVATHQVYWEFSGQKNDSSVSFSIDAKGMYGCRDMCYKAKNVSRSFESVSPVFDAASWHKVAMRFYRGAFKLWLDDRCAMESGGCHFIPTSMRIGAIGQVAIREVKLTRQVQTSTFKSLLNGNKLTAHNINFRTNSAELEPECLPYLELLASFLKENQTMKLKISGHTDGTGTEASNLLLSEKRALSIKMFLVSRGIDLKRLESIGLGSSQPLSTNSTNDGRWQNRRVEFQRVPQ